MFTTSSCALSKLKICFVAEKAYPLFNSQSKSVFGGIEVRSYLLGKGLSRLDDVEVCYIVGNHGQPSQETFDGIGVFRHPAYFAKGYHPFILKHQIATKEAIFEDGIALRTRSFPFYNFRNRKPFTFLRFLLAVILTVLLKVEGFINLVFAGRKLQIENFKIPERKWKIYESIDADIYCAFGAATLSAELAAFCRKMGKKSVLFIADEYDINALYQPHSRAKNLYGHPAFLCHYALTQSDLIITQTHAQAQKLKATFGRDAVVISNPVDLESLQPDTQPYEQRQDALWVGRADGFKKMPMRLIQLAKASPETQFVMIMNPEDSFVEAEVMQSCPPNVTIHRHVPYVEVERFYSRAFVFINTSEFEGFPNTFLQAGKYGVPILSYKIDPDGFIEKQECGIIAAGDFEKFVNGLRCIQDDQKQSLRFSHNIQNYVRQYHSLEDKVQIIREEFRQLIN